MTVGTKIADAAHLAVVPDGTIISWLRIPGDTTSEAVAFVRRESWRIPATEETGVDVWISPGGWDPQTIEDAGVNFPATVIRWGDVAVEPLTGAEIPTLMETLDSGGTWARQAALDAAARVFTGTGATYPRTTVEDVLGTAERLQEWLNRPDPDEATLPERLRVGADAIDQAREILGPTAEVGLKVEQIRFVAEQWPRWMAQRAARGEKSDRSEDYEQGYRDGGSSATVDWQGEIERAREIAEDQMVADLRQLTNGDPKDPTFVSIGLAMSRRGWVRIEPQE